MCTWKPITSWKFVYFNLHLPFHPSTYCIKNYNTLFSLAFVVEKVLFDVQKYVFILCNFLKYLRDYSQWPSKPITFMSFYYRLTGFFFSIQYRNFAHVTWHLTYFCLLERKKTTFILLPETSNLISCKKEKCFMKDFVFENLLHPKECYILIYINLFHAATFRIKKKLYFCQLLIQ